MWYFMEIYIYGFDPMLPCLRGKVVYVNESKVHLEKENASQYYTQS